MAGVPAAAAYCPDGITERLLVARYRSLGSLTAAVSRLWDGVFAVPRGLGVVCILLSAMLCRGLGSSGGSGGSGGSAQQVGAGRRPGGSPTPTGVAADWDEGLGGGGRLIGSHNYATQEAVALLLTGRARSNTFDGEKRIGGDKAEEAGLLLRGADSRADVGMLTLFEHYGHAPVGSRLKDPAVPVWVVCSESHFTALWSADPSVVDDGGDDGRAVELWYWDGLARQEEEIHFTVTPPSAQDQEQVSAASRQREEEAARRAAAAAAPVDLGFGTGFGGGGGALGDLLASLPDVSVRRGGGLSGEGLGEPDEDPETAPPLHLVLRTRWAGSHISWNGAMPLL